MKRLLPIIGFALLAGCSSVGDTFQEVGNDLVMAGSVTVLSTWGAPFPLEVVSTAMAIPLYGLGAFAHGVGSAMGGSIPQTGWL